MRSAVRLAVLPALFALIAASFVFPPPSALGNAAAPVTPKGMLRHVVLTAYKDDMTDAQRAELETAMRSFVTEIPQVRSWEWGPLADAGKRAQGYTHCMLITFDDVAAKDAYAAHPAHQRFLLQAMPFIKQILVFDYVAAE